MLPVFTQDISDNSMQVKPTPRWLGNFISCYQTLSPNNLDSLSALYHKDVIFQDPLHRITGYEALAQYFKQLYTNINHCDFAINEVFYEHDRAAIYWTMTYCHSQLNHGRAITVQGHSLIRGSEQLVTFHRDYIDLSEMLYEHVPVLGRLIKWFKKRIAQ